MDENRTEEAVKKIEAVVAAIPGIEQHKEVKTEEPTTSVTEENSVTKQEEYSEVEREAMSIGWKPNGGPKSAEEWLRAAPLYDRLKKIGKDNDSLRKTVDMMKNYIESQKRATHERELAELKERRRDAIALSDINEVEQLDEHIYRAMQSAPEPEPIAIPQEAQEYWDQHKDWLEGERSTTPKARAVKMYLMQRDQELATENLSPSEHIRRLDSELKEAFPDFFVSSDPNESYSSVLSDASPTKNPSKAGSLPSFNALNAEQQKCCRLFVKQGLMTQEQYIKSLVSAGEI